MKDCPPKCPKCFEDPQVTIDRLQAELVAEKRKSDAKQARIDELMFEYCPDDMTREQLDEYARHQRRVSPEEAAEVDRKLGIQRGS